MAPSSWQARPVTRTPTARVVANERPLGVCGAVNAALENITTEHVCGIAADDCLEPGAITTLVGAIETVGPETVFAYGDAHIVDEGGNRTGETMLGVKLLQKDRRKVTPCSSDWFGQTGYRRWPQSSDGALLAVGGYDESLPFEDYDMWLRLSHRWPVAYVPAVVCDYFAPKRTGSLRR